MTEDTPDDPNWSRLHRVGLQRLNAMIDMPDQRAQELVSILLKHRGFSTEDRDRFPELTLDELGPLVSDVVFAFHVEENRIGRERIAAGEYEDLDDVIADMDRIIEGSDAMTEKPEIGPFLSDGMSFRRRVRFSWLEEAGTYSLAVRYSQMWPFEVEEIEQLARKWGFDTGRSGQLPLGTKTGNWTPPEPAEAIPAMRNALREIGVATVFEGEEDDNGRML